MPDGQIRLNEAQLEAELLDTRLLQGISAQLISEDNVDNLYEAILDAAVAIMRSDYASMQMLYPERGSGGELRLLAHRGFSQQAATFWEWVRADSESTCGAALRTGQRVISPDVEAGDWMAGTDDLATYLQTGMRAVQTTPLISRAGRVVGMLSTHWRSRHQPSERDLRLLDILGRQAADLIERRQAEEALRLHTQQFETLLNQAPLGVYLVDADFRIREVNPVALAAFGDVPGGVIGRDFDKIIHQLWEETYADEVVRIFRHTLATGEPYVTPEHAEFRIDRGITEYYEWRLDRITLPDRRYGVVCYFRDISDQVWARQRLEALNERLEAARAEAYAAGQRLSAIFNQAAVGIAQTDLEGRFVLVNDRYAEIVGRPRAELLGGLRMQDLTHPDDLTRNLELFGRTVRDGGDFVIEKRYVRPDGAHVWVRNSVSRVEGQDGTPSYIVAVSEDITERTRAEEALRESERRYRRIFDTAAVSIWEEDFSGTRALLEELRAAGVADLRAYLEAHPDVLRRAVQSVRVVEVNEQTLRLFDAQSKDELLASLERVFVPETLPAFCDELVAIFEGRRAVASEAQLRTVHGERRDVVFTMALPEPGAAFDSVLLSLIDVTEQRRAEAEAERLRLDFYAMLMQAPVPIAVVAGPELVFELANQRYLEVVGGRDIAGKPVLEALPELRGQGYDELLRGVMRTGQPAVARESLVKLERAGSLQDTYWTFIYAPLRDRGGVVDRVMTICQEVTEQVRARQQVEASLRARDEFLSSAAHDLRTPLTTIKGLSQLLQRQIRRGGAIDLQRLADGLAGIDLTATQMAEQLDELTDLTLLQIGGPLELRRRATDLAELARRVAAGQQQTTDRHRIQVDTPASSLVGHWDSARLARVLHNLVANAIKYSPAGGEVRLSLARDESNDGAWAVLTVEDAGLGIPRDDLPRIFERFERASNVVGRVAGTGVGLASARQIVQHHGGTITVASQEGAGTTFTVRLPLGLDQRQWAGPPVDLENRGGSEEPSIEWEGRAPPAGQEVG